MRDFVLIFLFLTFMSAPGESLAADRDAPLARAGTPSAVGLVLGEFVSAVESSNIRRVSALLDEEVTIFAPFAELGARRIEGKAGATRMFQTLFDIARARNITMKIRPAELRVLEFGDAALATFHLNADEEGVSRRTIVLRRSGPTWRIVHIHASWESHSPDP